MSTETQTPIRIGLVGIGKIARDQHAPTLAADSGFVLTATASPHGRLLDIPAYPTLEAMLDAHPEMDAVALCTPPQVRHGLAHSALLRGKHVFLEKPPGATLSEVEDLAATAARVNKTLFASWHSRFAPAVEPARAWLSERRIVRARIVWRENVRVWHPGQDWIWRPGGLGVFDPGINALSIATALLPKPFFLTEATLDFPENRQAPIAATLLFSGSDLIPITAEFDWRETGPQIWDIEIETDDGRLRLSDGGAVATVHGEGGAKGQVLVAGVGQEYAGLYRRFAGLIALGTSEVDLSPLRHVADAFLLGARRLTDAFIEA